MSQFDQVRDVLKQLDRVADRLTRQGDSEALRDLFASLVETNNYFADYAEQQEEAIIKASQEGIIEEEKNEDLSFDLDSGEETTTPAAPVTAPKVNAVSAPQITVAKKTTAIATVTQGKDVLPSQQQQQSKQQLSQQKDEEKLQKDLKAFKEIELYIGDKFTQYGCTFEQDLFTPNDPLKIGIIHCEALLLILRKLGVYLSPSEVDLLMMKFKPTEAQVADYIDTHEVVQSNLPIEQKFINYSIFFLYLQALNNVALSSRSVIQSNVPAMMAGRALKVQPSNPHPLHDPLKSGAKIKGLILDKDSQRQIAAFNEPMAQVTLVSEHANKPKGYVVDLVAVQKLIKEFASCHPSPSKIYSSMKRSAAHTANVTQYGENTMTIDALVVGLKTFNFKMSELPCSLDVFKDYIQLYSVENIPAIRFPEFISFLNCETPKNGWDGLLSQVDNVPTSQMNQLELPSNKKMAQEEEKNKKDANFAQVITAVVNDSSFSQAIMNFSAANPRQLFRHLARGDMYVSVKDIINYLIDSRCPERLILNDNFKKFVMMYSTTRNEKLNYNDFVLFKDCKLNYVEILNDTFTKKTIVPDDAGLYTSFKLISDHFNVTNPHLSFHYCTLAVLPDNISKELNFDKKYQLNQVEFYNALYTAHITISYDQAVQLYDQLNARGPVAGQCAEDVVQLHPSDVANNSIEGENGSMIVPLVYLPLTVVYAIVSDPMIYPLIQKAYTVDTGLPYSTHTATTKRATSSNAAALNDDSDLVKLMEQLCLNNVDEKPKVKPNPRFQSSLIQDMTDVNFNAFSNHDLQQGTRKHFAEHIQSRKQIRTSIGFGNRGSVGTSNGLAGSNSITTEDAEMIHRQRISNQSATLTIGFGASDHGGRTPIKSREGIYQNAGQTYSLAMAQDEMHEVQFGYKSSRKTQTTFDTIDEYELSMQQRHLSNPRSFTSSVLKLRSTPVQSRPQRMQLAPQTKVVLGVQPDFTFTPQKANEQRRAYPNRNQTAVQMQLQTPGYEEKKYTRAQYDPEVSRQAIGHLNDGFQPTDTPFLLRRQAKFAKLTQREQVLQDDLEYTQTYERLAEMINPRDNERRRTGYTNTNNVIDLMNLEHAHPVYQKDNQLINDIDAAVLNKTELAQYIVDNTNRSYKDLASRQLIRVKRGDEDNKELVMPTEAKTTPLFTSQNGQNDALMNDDDQGEVFTLDDVGADEDVAEKEGEVVQIEEEIAVEGEKKEILPPGQLSEEELHDINVLMTRLTFRIGKSREVFSKWSEYTNALDANHLYKAMTTNDVAITLQNAQQLIDSVNQEQGGVLNLSGFSRLLGRGAE